MFLLSVYSYYSLMRGCSSPDRICARARDLGFSGIALTDHNSLTGIWEFLAACKKYSLHPIIGAELRAKDSGFSVVCLVRNHEGYANLCNWISLLKKRNDFSLLNLGEMDSDGLFVLSSSLTLLQTLQASSVAIVADLGSKPTEQGGVLRKWASENNIPAVATASAVMASKEDRKSVV